MGVISPTPSLSEGTFSHEGDASGFLAAHGLRDDVPVGRRIRAARSNMNALVSPRLVPLPAACRSLHDMGG